LALDRDVALLRVGGDEDLLKEIAAIFLSDYPKVLVEIQAAIANHDAKRLEASAHGLKGSVANFGAQDVVDAAFRLEQMGRAGRIDADDQRADASHELEKLSRSLSMLRVELEAL